MKGKQILYQWTRRERLSVRKSRNAKWHRERRCAMKTGLKKKFLKKALDMKGSRRERQNEEGKIIKGKWTEI